MTLETGQNHCAIFFDGASNRKHEVALSFTTGLDIVEDGVVIAIWPYEAIRRMDGPPALLRLGCASAPPLARLEIADPATAEAVARHSPSLDDGRGGAAQTGRIVFWSIAAICSILLVAIYGVPLAADRLAPLTPVSVENRIGEAVDAQVRLTLKGKVCAEAEGQAAFRSLVDKLKRAGGMDMPIEAKVLSGAMPNAFALPGGKVYLLDGLLQRARDPDEIAGIVAHELAHVRHRDGLRRIIQAGGTSFLIGLLLGDLFGSSALIFATQSILDASYSREAEQGADAFTVEVMHKLGRSPRPTGELLFRITGAEGKSSITILNSHPLTEDRLAMMKKHDRPNTGPALLSDKEWAALKSICKTPSKQAEESGRRSQ
jgi:Zn-dependent protease with chaperone function